jgi:hypothetical protein
MIIKYSSFYGEDLTTPRSTSGLEDHPLSAVRHCLFIILATTLHSEGRSSIRNLRTRNAVVTATLLSRSKEPLFFIFMPVKNQTKKEDV